MIKAATPIILSAKVWKSDTQFNCVFLHCQTNFKSDSNQSHTEEPKDEVYSEEDKFDE